MKAKKMVKTAYHYRFLLAFLVFILCVVFEISGSSIGLWQDFTGVSTESWDGVLLGKSREIRTDEWAVNTPMAFSQYATAENRRPFPITPRLCEEPKRMPTLSMDSRCEAGR